MSDDPPADDGQRPAVSTNVSTNLSTSAVTSPYKVLGELTADEGVGVLGQNNAESGTPIGVEGAVPNAIGGYGLSTPNDANIGGTAELDSIDTTGADLTVKTNDTGDVNAGNVIFGHANNEVDVSVTSATVAGGGEDIWPNVVTDSYGTVGGGKNNTAGAGATVGGGETNTASGSRATVGGGWNNDAGADFATIAGGGPSDTTDSTSRNDTKNVVYDNYSTVGGGGNNQAGSDDDDPSTAEFATVGGGDENTAGASHATVGGGQANTADAGHATIGGGIGNSSDGLWTTVGGGENNTASNDHATVGGGESNHADGNLATIGGGFSNNASPTGATIGGGGSNEASGIGATVGGGGGNTASDDHATVGGGQSNQAGPSDSDPWTAEFATVGGGSDNTASGTDATVPGGHDNTAIGTASFAAGSGAHAADDHTFVWSDGTGYHDPDENGVLEDFSSSEDVAGSGVTGTDTFHASASGGFRFLTSETNVTYISGGSAGWSTTSSRSAKTNVEAVDSDRTLDAVAGMEVSTWEYRDADGDGRGERHIGPMAEDFHAAFDVGNSDAAINSINADGVLFAAVQGLARRLEAKDERMDAQSDRIDELESRLDTLAENYRAVSADD